MKLEEAEVLNGCAEKMYDQCYARLKEELEALNEADRKRAEERLSQEIDIVDRFGYSSYFYLTKLIADYAKSKRRLAFIGRLAAYSYMAYLLGISDVDPISAGYCPEMVFGPRGERNPFNVMTVCIPQGFAEDITKYLRELFGDEYFIKEGSYVLLDDGSEFYKGIELKKTDLVSKADEIIALKRGRDSDEIFLKERNTIFLRKDMFRSGGLGPGYVDQMHAVALAHGSGVPGLDTANKLDSVFYTRDDAYRYGLELFKGRTDLAFDFMERLRKGMGGLKRVQDMLEEYGAEEGIKEQVKGIDWLISEGACIPEMQLEEYIEKHAGVF